VSLSEAFAFARSLLFAIESDDKAQKMTPHERIRELSRGALLLEPNLGSDLKVHRYLCSLNPKQFSAGNHLVCGEINEWIAFRKLAIRFAADALWINIARRHLVFISSIQVADYEMQTGGIQDGYDFSSSNPHPVRLALPTCEVDQIIQVRGTWTGGVLEDGYRVGDLFALCLTFEGWGTIVPGGAP
jgi:hypothetical protein